MGQGWMTYRSLYTGPLITLSFVQELAFTGLGQDEVVKRHGRISTLYTHPARRAIGKNPF
jgi:hypothetical protein